MLATQGGGAIPHLCERNLVGGEARLLLMLLVLLLRGSLHKGLLACPRRHWVAVLHVPLPKSVRATLRQGWIADG